MEKCIDLFSRLLIATITFVVPILINLLSSFSEGEKRRKELSKSTEDLVSKQAAEEIQTSPGTVKQTVARTHEEFQRIEKETKKELNLLSPIQQFWRIFASLGTSFIALNLAYLVRENRWGTYSHFTSVVILFLSFLGYAVALFFIIRILYTVSRTKRIV